MAKANENAKQIVNDQSCGGRDLQDRSARMLRVFIAATSRRTPISEAIATLTSMTEASIPSKATIAKLLTPTSLFDHSRSIPTSIPMPMATAIFKAMGVARETHGFYLHSGCAS